MQIVMSCRQNARNLSDFGANARNLPGWESQQEQICKKIKLSKINTTHPSGAIKYCSL